MQFSPGFAVICNNDAGVAGGATRAALTQHFSRADNAGDISAKEGSQVFILLHLCAQFALFPHCCYLPMLMSLCCGHVQETATTLIGMILGMAFLQAASGELLILLWSHVFWCHPLHRALAAT